MSACLGDNELRRYHDGLLSAKQCEEVERHLDACAGCAARSAALCDADRELFDDLRAINPAEIVPPAADGPTALAIEGYEVLEELHRGGQGVVFRAIQQHAKREVAIKVLLEGPYASPTARRRFEREIELAARLEHPNIVTVFHSGRTADGRDYCVMDYVRGVPLDQYVRQHGLSLEDTLAMFATICDAVMYAHQRGIIHRDLKPSNILVDSAGVPKVLDFGLAKQLVGPAESLASISGQVFGTLPYMSPEQTAGKPDEIDTRSDVYALGVILYQLLTGQFPYPVTDSLPEVIRHITDTPPVMPSRAWTRDSGVLRRRTQERALAKCPIDGEVQTIILKTLAKEPQRRYQSAFELASDVRHYLAGEPIAAKRDSHWYVLQKTLRRYKLRFAAAAVIVLLAVGSSVALSIMYGQQSVLLEQVEGEKTRAVAAEGRAERRFEQVRDLARTFIFDFHDQIQHLKGSTAARELLVTKALEYLDALAGDTGDDPSLLRELALAYQKVGDVQGAPGAPNLGDSAGALNSYTQAVQILESLHESEPANAARASELAECLYSRGNLLLVLKRTADAAADYERAFAIYGALARSQSDDVAIQLGLARGYMSCGDVQKETGHTAAALESFRAALRIRQQLAAADSNDLAVARAISIVHGRIGKAQAALGDREAALTSYRDGLKIAESLAAQRPDDSEAQRDLAEDLTNVGDALRPLGKFDEALTYYEKAMAIRRDLAQADPENNEAKRDLTMSYNRVGGVQQYLGETAAALATYQAGLAIVRDWAAAEPDDVRPQKALRVYYTSVGDCQKAAKAWDEAMASYTQALDIARKLAAIDPDSAASQRDVSVGLCRVGDAQRFSGKLDGAMRSYMECLGIRQNLVKADPANFMYQRNLGEIHYLLGVTHKRLGADESLSRPDRLEHWRQARDWFDLACEAFVGMQEAGTLLSYDAKMPEGSIKGVAECDAAIAELSETPVADQAGRIVMTDAGRRVHEFGLLIDGHNDLPWHIRELGNSSFDELDIGQPQPSLQTDIPRLRTGGVDAQFWVIYVPPESAATGEAKKITLEQFDLIDRMVARYDDFEAARTADDIVRIHKEGKIAALIGIEGGHTIENSLANLKEYYDRGARYLGLTHSATIDWADSATDEPRNGGLSAFGEEVVLEMNRLGMLVDLAHVSADTMRDVLRVSKAPVIASHSSAYAVAQHNRNVPDDVLRTIAEKNGVVMVCFFSGYIEPDGARAMAEYFEKEREIRAQYHDDADYKRAWKEWKTAHPVPAGTVHTLIDHIDHIVRVAGIDHVGLGSDYEGARKFPVQLEDVSGYPFITQELLNRGYSEQDIHKIMGGNLLRVLRDAERVAREWPS